MTDNILILNDKSADQVPAAPYAFRLDFPLQIFNGPLETPISVENFGSLYRLADDTLAQYYYTAKPHSLLERFTGILWRLPIGLAASYTNHELGHLRSRTKHNVSDYEVMTDHPSFDASSVSGGFERSLKLANTLVVSGSLGQPSFGSHLEYTVAKLDSLYQRYTTLFKHKRPAEYEADPYAVGFSISWGKRQYARKHNIVLPNDSERVRGYSDRPGIIGNVVHLFDPVFLWSAWQVIAGDGRAVPDSLPQLHYLDSAEGPMLFARFRQSLRRKPEGTAGTLLEYGAFTTINDRSDGVQAMGYELAAHHLPIIGDQVTMDLAHRGAMLPVEGYVADAEANWRVGLGTRWSVSVGLNYKFGDGYIPMAHFFDGPTVMLGVELTQPSPERRLTLVHHF